MSQDVPFFIFRQSKYFKIKLVKFIDIDILLSYHMYGFSECIGIWQHEAAFLLKIYVITLLLTVMKTVGKYGAGGLIFLGGT